MNTTWEMNYFYPNEFRIKEHILHVFNTEQVKENMKNFWRKKSNNSFAIFAFCHIFYLWISGSWEDYYTAEKILKK